MIEESEIEALIEKAKSASGSFDSPDQAIGAVAEYVEAFQTWFTANQQHLTETAGLPAELLKLLEDLQENHDHVLARSQVLQSEASADMRKLKTRGKGIMAYADTLPKRISVLGKRKG